MPIFAFIALFLLTLPTLQEAKSSKKAAQASEKTEISTETSVESSVTPAITCPNKMIKNMNTEELEQAVAYFRVKKDQESLFQAYYKLINHSQDHVSIKKYKLDLADFCFEIKDFAKAHTKYEEFCLLYPGSQESEYAQYKLILCLFYLSLEADRDQNDTHKTINCITVFLKRAKNELFIQETQDIYKTCRKRLFEHEVIVFDTYLKLQKFTGAQKRLEYISSHFDDIENIDKYIVYLQNIYETVKNPATRPFIFKIKLADALVAKPKSEKTDTDVKKTVAFFIA